MMTEKQKAALQKSYSRWRRDPLQWAEDKFSEAIKSGKIRFSSQQKGYFEEVGKLVLAKLKLKKEFEGKELKNPWTEEEREYSRKIGISIMAGVGVGKDFMSAMTMLWFMDCFGINRQEDCKVVGTGANANHLRNVLWAEASKIAALADRQDKRDASSPTCLQALFEFGVSRIEHKGNPKNWFAEAITINRNSNKEEQAGSLAGRHADNMLVIVDEAAATPDAALLALQDTLTKPVNFALMIFNPIKRNCFAVKSHYEATEKERWVRLHWPSNQSELVTPEFLASFDKYGKDSFRYRVRILGLPPIVDSNAIIPDDWVYAAFERPLFDCAHDPVLAGVDVGGGGDKSVICIRQGGNVLKFEYNNSKNMMEVADWVTSVMLQNDVACAFVDVVGIGRGVYDRLGQLGMNVRTADSRNKAMRDDLYYNKRAEMYMTARSQFENGTIAFSADNEDLIIQGAAVTYKPEEKCKVARKEEIRKVIGESPDDLDALVLSFAYPDHLFSKSGQNEYLRPLSYGSQGVYA